MIAQAHAALKAGQCRPPRRIVEDAVLDCNVEGAGIGTVRVVGLERQVDGISRCYGRRRRRERVHDGSNVGQADAGATDDEYYPGEYPPA